MADNGIRQETIQCSRCKKRFFEDGFRVNRLGRRNKTCLECNAEKKAEAERYKCPHNKQKNSCRLCSPEQLCDHNRLRRYCKHCTPSSHCLHGRRRQQCRECDATAFCEHGKRHVTCKDCGGGGLCPCGKVKGRCRNCGGSAYCHHGQLKHRCRECGGVSICPHEKRRDCCRVCSGCPHGKRKHHCVLCDHGGYLRSIVSHRILVALKSDKDKGSLEYLGCDIETFRAHIEALFTDGMTWDNHGQGEGMWNIDHIIPIKYPGATGGAPTLEEVAARLHYTNTQPMWASENIAKGNKFIGRAGEVQEPSAEAEKPPLLTDDELAEALAEFGF